MRRSVPRAGLLAIMALAACAGSGPGPAPPPTPEHTEAAAGNQSVLTPAALAKADSGRPAYTVADVHFMSSMIAHHAQAVLMAGWAPSHGSSQAVRALCERIVVGQRDEIAFMQSWLRDRREPVPDGNPSHSTMPGMAHLMMPGMLTAEQLTRLDQARGNEFDRLFLTFMIQHHKGALTMVQQLFGSYGAGQDQTVFKFASDVNVDQTTEIARMEKMLSAVLTAP
jgi:uncharacterized protein (DUF305 family)